MSQFGVCYKYQQRWEMFHHSRVELDRLHSEAAAVSRAQIGCPLWQQEVTSHQQEEGRSWQEMDDFLGAAFYRNTTSKSVYRLTSAEALYKHNVNAALYQSEHSEEGRGGGRGGGGRRRRRKQQETREKSFISPSFFCRLIKRLFLQFLLLCLPFLWMFAVSWLVGHHFLAQLWLDAQTQRGNESVCVCVCVCVCVYLLTKRRLSSVYIREMIVNLHQHTHKHLFIQDESSHTLSDT